MKHSRSLLIALAFVCCGCSQTFVNYKASPVAGDSQARQILSQLLSEQTYSGKPITDVEVSEDHFKVDYVKTRYSSFLIIPTGVTSIDRADFVYFNNVADIECYKGHGFTVYLKDVAGKTIYRYRSHRADKAERFMDVIAHLSNGV